jgi:hypothetical protein
MLGLFFLSEIFQQTFDSNNTALYIIKLEITIPAIMNFILLLICDEFYEKIADELTDYENHKTINDSEMNFVIKKYFLTFISLCGPILEITFTHELIGLKCS